MSIGNLQGSAFTDPSAPEAPGVCDRCGQKYMRSDLVWQHDYRGNVLQNLRILVCTKKCLDTPQDQLRPIIVPPDPMPIKDPRPDFYAQQMGAAPPVQYVVNLLYGPNFIETD